MCFGGPKERAAPEPVKEPGKSPERVDPNVVAARNEEKKRIRGFIGRKSTIKTGARGLDDTDANVKPKTLGGVF